MSALLRRPPELAAYPIVVVAWLALVAGHAVAPAAGRGAMGPATAAVTGRTGALAAAWVLWVAMAAAMMVPAALPAARHVAENSFRWRRHRAVTAFLAAYVAVWAGFGLLAVALVAGLGALAATRDLPIAMTPVVALALAAVWQASPWKRDLLRACGKSIPLFPRGWAATRSCLRFGARHGTRCVGSCWALMLAMATASTGHLAWTAALTAVVLLERSARILRRHPELLAPAWLAALVAVVTTRPAGGALAHTTAYFCTVPLN